MGLTVRKIYKSITYGMPAWDIFGNTWNVDSQTPPKPAQAGSRYLRKYSRVRPYQVIQSMSIKAADKKLGILISAYTGIFSSSLDQA